MPRSTMAFRTPLMLLAVPLLLFGLLLLAYARARRRAARFHADAARAGGPRLNLTPVQRLRVLPLIDWYSARDDLETEAGVSYLVKADETTILFDLGLNRRRGDEPPLLRNMARLGVAPAAIDFVVISHPHLDHLGGVRNQLTRRAIVRVQDDPLAGKPVYATVPLRATGGSGTVVAGPRVLAPGVGTTGPLPAALFVLGYTLEQALAINVAGKGLVVIAGCGHPGVTAIVEGAERAFRAPVYGVIGGLHFPVTDERAKVGPFRPQKVLGCPRPPWRPVGRGDVQRAVTYLQAKGVQLVSPSAHDTCDWSLATFAEAFGDRFRPLRVGETIEV